MSLEYKHFNQEIFEDRSGYLKKVVLVFLANPLLFGLAWVGFYATPFVNPFTLELFSALGVSSLIVAAVISISMVVFRKKITRAVHYYWLITVLVFIAMLIMFAAAFLQAANVYGNSTWQLLVVTILVAMQFGFLQFKSDFERLKANVSDNTKSGRYTSVSGLWNVRRALHWDNPKNEKQTFIKYERLSKLSYLIPGIGYLIARNSTEDEMSLFFFYNLLHLCFNVCFGNRKAYSHYLSLAIS